MSKGRYKKTMLNLDEEDLRRMGEIYGRTLGISMAVRTLISKHLQHLAKRKEEQTDNTNKE